MLHYAAHLKPNQEKPPAAPPGHYQRAGMQDGLVLAFAHAIHNPGMAVLAVTRHNHQESWRARLISRCGTPPSSVSSLSYVTLYVGGTVLQLMALILARCALVLP